MLRPWRPSDLDAFAAIESDPEFRRYVGTGRPLTLETARAEIEGFEDEWRRLGHGRWAVEEGASGELIGACGVLSWQEGTPEGTGEVAYGFARSRWGRGLATEAAQASVVWAFANFDFDSLVGLTHPENAASQRVLAKLGMQYEGLFEGRYQILNVYRVSRAAFLASAERGSYATAH